MKTPLKEKQSPPQNQSTSNTKPKQILTKPAHTTYAKAAAGNIENGLSFMRINSPTQQLQAPQSSSIDLGTSPLANFIASNNLAHLKGPQPTDVKEIESQRDPKLQVLLKKPTGPPKANNAGAAAPINTTPGKPAKLMPPTMFETTAVEPPNVQRTGAQSTPNAKAGKNESNETNKKNAAQKGKEASQQKSRKKSSHEQQPTVQQSDNLCTTVQPLTETQLLQALSYLMKNDPGFIRKIHEAYLKSFADMVSQ